MSPAVGFILCHAVLNTDAAALSLWKLALQSSTCLCLFRDEVFHIHKAAEDLFVNIRGRADTQRPTCDLLTPGSDITVNTGQGKIYIAEETIKHFFC